MKKTVLSILTLLAFTGGAMAQGYYHLKTKGTAAPYSSLVSPNTVVVAQGSNNVLSTEQNLPFAWNFYGKAVTSYKVSDNGYITFATGTNTSVGANVAIPDIAAPLNAIYAFWDELELKAISGSGVKTEARTFTYGTAPNRSHVIQWFTASKTGTAAGSANYLYFAIRINEGAGFDIIYNDASPNVAGLSGTIGCQNEDGTIGTMVAGPSADFPNKLGSQENATDLVYKFVFGTQPSNDAFLSKISLPKISGKNDPITVKGVVTNYGAQSLTSFKINYQVNNGQTQTMNILGVDIAPSGGEFEFTHNIPYVASASGAADFKVWITDPNGGADGDLTNNEKSGSVIVVDRTIPRRALHEVFTSSTCPPCKPGNETLTEVLNTRVGKWSVIKYQYYFPGTGDPYFTPEALARATYYGGVSAVPNMFIDGGWNDNPNGFDEDIFDQFQTTPSIVDIKTSLTMTGSKADISVKVTPTADMPTGNYKLRVAIVERETVKNIKTNGETSFHFVMKKMVPNETGTTFTFPVKETEKTVNLSYTFPGSYRLAGSATKSSGAAPTGSNYNGIDIATENSVEEPWDLAVVAFIQNDDTKEILQSSWTVQDWAIGMKENVKNASDFNVYPNPATNDLVIEWNGSKDAKFRMLDLNGKEVMSEMSINSSINIENLNTGIYVIEMVEAGKTITKKVSIIR
ncbi:hypothetical protein MASR2M44_00570 [Bacteroidota bacterium]